MFACGNVGRVESHGGFTWWFFCPVLPPSMGPKAKKGRKRGHTGVHHHVHRALREDGPVARRELLRHQPRAVLLVHVRRRVAVHGDDVVCGAGVQVRRQHGAGPQVQHRHWFVALRQ